MKKWIDVLSTIAESNDGVGRAKLAAGIIYKNKLVAVGLNSLKTHPFAAEFGKNEHAVSWHAETRAIHTALKKLSEKEISRSTLVVVRVKEEGRQTVVGLAKPCEGCQRCIEHHNIRTVVYTIDSKPKKNSWITEKSS